MGVIINQLHQLKDARESKEVQERQMATVSDFDVESVCSFLTQASEVR